MQGQPSISAPMRFRIRVTVQLMMGLVAAFGIGLAWVKYDCRRRAQLERDALQAIIEAGGSVWFGEQSSQGTRAPQLQGPRGSWLADLFGSDPPEARFSIELPDECRSDQLLVHVGRLRELQELDLAAGGASTASGTCMVPVNDARLAHLRGLTSLRELRLGYNDITDAGLRHLQAMTKMEVLDLSGTDVGDAALAHLAGLTKLRQLKLNRTAVTDAGLVHLAGMTGLQVLELSHTRVSDAGIAELKGLNKLESIDLSHTWVTDFGAHELGRSLPTARIAFTTLPSM
jgi:Leucine Rich repeat